MSSPPPTLTYAGCLHGARLMLPVLPGLVVYATAFGAAAAGRGLSFGEGVAMSGIVYAGASQMVSLELWRGGWTPLAVLTVALVTATVNARLVLMGAAIQPWLRGAPRLSLVFGLFFMVDAAWLIASRYRDDGGRDIGVLFGAGMVSWIVWVAATIPGLLAGSLVVEPARFGLDLVMPVFFAAMAVPLWRGARVSGLPWATAGIVAALFAALVPGYVFIVAGAVAGAVVAGLSGGEPSRG